MANGEATGPDDLPAELLKLELSKDPSELLHHFNSTIDAVWTPGILLWESKEAITEVLHEEDRTECGNCRVIAPMALVGKVLRLGSFCDGAGIFPESQCGF